MSKLLFNNLSNQILNVAFYIHNLLGPGLVESIYHRALEIELGDRNIPFVSKMAFLFILRTGTWSVFIRIL